MQPTDLTPLKLAQRADNAAANLTTSHTYLAREKEALLEAKETLRLAETNHILAGVEGKNAETRNAHLADKTITERNALLTAEHKVIQAEADYHQRRIAWQLTCELIKLATA